MLEGEILANIEFDYTFAGKVYKLKKANIKQTMEWQRKIAEIKKADDPAADLAITVYTLYISLKVVDTTITEEYILENCPGTIDPMETFFELGFMSRQKVKSLLGIRNAPENQSTGEKSTG